MNLPAIAPSDGYFALNEVSSRHGVISRPSPQTKGRIAVIHGNFNLFT